MTFLARVMEQARRAPTPRRVVLPEGDDPRVQEAARRIAAEEIAVPVVLTRASPFAKLEASVQLLRTRRPEKFPTEAAAAEALRHPITYGACLVALGEADAMVGGCAHPTGDVIRAALWAVGPAPGLDLVSSAFYMTLGDRVLTFTDGAVVPDPTPDQLAQIALAAARDRRRVVGDAPVVAFLSYSTKGSAAGPLVDRVRQAVAAFHRLAPDVPADGELQGDAALVGDIGRSKAPGSPVAGQANILVFPNLDAGNIAYKLVQWLGGWRAIGPILQGVARPMSDLSRGASADDIVETVAVTVLQAEEPG
ncbi:MAG TPA: phosphate acyltransferase [Gemmatimonadales bacterium]|nr:phosphate acyltransferase [Gemmatimonadales bacterium]